ncbi:geraniol 8-hydroxylase-like [Prunus dulcis]|uniref:geraniol 8-hydroxylase-like n=1 Tax=Prunus dulcis TaxID=3755 RepID=UPI00148222B6|nr:geraniol 8-hydroxylase-like [Prunus dulcis]
MDFLSFCMVLLSLFSVLFSIIQALRSKANPKRHLLPPGPKPFPFIGNLLELGNEPHQSLTKLSQIYGPIITLQLGQVTTVVVSSPNTAKQVLQTHDQFLSNRTVPDAIQACDLRQDSLPWIPPSAKWRSLRQICNSQLFAAKILDANQPNRCVKVQELISQVNESAINGEAVDIGRAAFKTTLNLLSRTVFSVDLADPSSEMAREFKETVWGLMEGAGSPNVGDFFPVLRKIDPQGIRRRMIKHFNKMEQLFDRMISQRLASRKAHDYVKTNDMLDTLLNISEANSEDMDKTKIQHLLYLPGTDTTSATLEWAMAELLRNPEKLSKAQQELEQIIGKGKPVEEADIARLPNLQAIIKETLTYKQ